MYLQVPIPPQQNIVVVTRFSTDEQRQESNQAQHEYCAEFLDDHDVAYAQIHQIRDEGISGELLSRPGIDELRQGIKTRKWDLVICEDSSRLYRGIVHCVGLVGLAVDHDVRVICINDFVDTANEDWQQRLEEAQRHHGQDNFFTRHRIKRAHDSLWKMGAAIGLKRSGYLRVHNNPNDPKSPKFDEIDPQWKETIVQAFKKVAAGTSLDLVADYLNEQKLPKT